MHSLEQLNNYSATEVIFTDERSPTFTITPNISVVASTINTVYGTEGDSHYLPVAFTFDTLTSMSGMTFNVNVSQFTGATVQWGGLPANLIYSNPATGIYQVSNIRLYSEWNTVKSPTVNLGPDTNGNVTYVSNLIVAPGAGNTITWTTRAILADTAEINTGILANVFYDEYANVSFNSGLSIVDTTPLGTYWANISFSDNAAGTLSSSGSGAYTQFSDHVLHIGGNKTDVNSHLGNILFTANSMIGFGYNEDFVLTYAVHNNLGGVTNYAIQNMKIGNKFDEVTDMYRTRYYTSNTASYIFSTNTPQIHEFAPDTSDQYSVDTYTNFLYHFNNSWSDVSSYNHIIANTSSSVFSTNHLFGNASASLGTGGSNTPHNIFSGDVLSMSTSSELDSWTWEGYVYHQGGSEAYTGKFFEIGGYSSYFGNSLSFSGHYNGSTISFIGGYDYSSNHLNSYPWYPAGSSKGNFIASANASSLQWHHVVISVEKVWKPWHHYDALFRIYVDGQRIYYGYPNIRQQFTPTTANTVPMGISIGSRIGSMSSAYDSYDGTTWHRAHDDYFNGFMDEVRFSKGITRYTGTSIPVALAPYTFKLKLNDSIGSINVPSGYYPGWQPNWDSATNTFTFTGTIDQCNAIFSQIFFQPNTGITSNSSITYTQYKRGIYQLSQTFDLIHQ